MISIQNAAVYNSLNFQGQHQSRELNSKTNKTPAFKGVDVFVEKVFHENQSFVKAPMDSLQNFILNMDNIIKMERIINNAAEKIEENFKDLEEDYVVELKKYNNNCDCCNVKVVTSDKYNHKIKKDILYSDYYDKKEELFIKKLVNNVGDSIKVLNQKSANYEK